MAGRLFILVGPSGVGKNSLIQCILEQRPDMQQLPTATTRAPRDGEKEGIHHFFLSVAEFETALAQGEVIESVLIAGNRYGTIGSILKKALASDRSFIADLDIDGARRLKHMFPDRVVTCFIVPPAPPLTVLEERLRQRGGLEESEIQSRLARYPYEARFARRCDHRFINNNLQMTTERILRSFAKYPLSNTIETAEEIYST